MHGQDEARSQWELGSLHPLTAILKITFATEVEVIAAEDVIFVPLGSRSIYISDCNCVLKYLYYYVRSYYF